MVRVSITGETRKSITYSDNGNILSRTGTGTYSYDPDKKNAVNEISSPGQDFILNNQDITYTSFNKVFTIADTILNDPYSMALTYGPDHQRVKRVQTKNGAVQKTKYYGLQYEKEIAGGNTIEINYVNSPYGLVAINRKVNSADTTFYVETDHLGSILALFDSGGNIKERFSYDPWGRRRNPDNWTYENIPDPLRLERGFTGHEHYDVFNLIDMNGRIYDPVIGRFLSIDPIIGSPGLSQNFNSYSYCLNNPLKFFDPFGYDKKEPLWVRIKRFFQNLFGGNEDEKKEENSPRNSSDNSYGEDEELVYMPIEGGGYTPSTYGSLAEIVVTTSRNQSSNNSTSSLIISPFRTMTVWGNTNAFDGIWGKVYWVFTGGNINGAHYNPDGTPNGPSPIMGIVPSSGIKGKLGKIGTISQTSKIVKGHKGVIQSHHLIEVRHCLRLGLNPRKVPNVVVSASTHNAITNVLRTEMPYRHSYYMDEVLSVYRRVYPPRWNEAIDVFLGF